MIHVRMFSLFSLLIFFAFLFGASSLRLERTPVISLVSKETEGRIHHETTVWSTTPEGGKILKEIRFTRTKECEEETGDSNSSEVISSLLKTGAVILIWKIVRLIKGVNDNSKKIEHIKKMKIQSKNDDLKRVVPLKKYSEKNSTHLKLEPIQESVLFEQITCMTSPNICDDIKSGQLSAEDCMRAYCFKALRAHQEFNCITEQWINEAIKEAVLCDEEIKKTGKIRGPLHGLPISLKDTIDVRGIDSTVGVIKNSFHPAQRDATVVEILKEAGAIPFLKTNVPQTLSLECSNPLFGRTLNPLNTNFTSGGSSGGEGCLLCYGGSPVGLGTDIGGSIRISAQLTGTCSLKPTFGRFPNKGFSNKDRQDAVPEVIGPMGRSVSDVILITKSIIDGKPWERDQACVPVPFNDEMLNTNRPLRVGYYTTDGAISPTPPCIRAVEKVVEILKNNGHTVIPFQPPNAERALQLYYSLISADGGELTKDRLRGEPFERFTNLILTVTSLPSFLKKPLVGFFTLMHDQMTASVLNSMRTKTMSEYWMLTNAKNEYREIFNEEWDKDQFDVLITPVNVLPAVPCNFKGPLGSSACYTMLYNLLDMPAGVLPVTKVKREDSLDYDTVANSGFMHRQIYQNYILDECIGMPVGVQVVGKRFQEEKVLRAMKVIEDLVTESDMKKFYESGWRNFDL